uniref:Transposase n=1 Tax=Octopus bimaculoides TaxID=37653 RepID=A0A0L8FLM3_OCTBM
MWASVAHWVYNVGIHQEQGRNELRKRQIIREIRDRGERVSNRCVTYMEGESLVKKY